MDFETWIRDQLAPGGGLPSEPVVPPKPRPRPGGRGRLAQWAVAIAAVAVILGALGSAGSVQPLQLQVVGSEADGLPVTTWEGVPPRSAGTTGSTVAVPPAGSRSFSQPLAPRSTSHLEQPATRQEAPEPSGDRPGGTASPAPDAGTPAPSASPVEHDGGDASEPPGTPSPGSGTGGY